MPAQLEPIMLGSVQAAALFNVTRWTWNDWSSRGLTPAPIQIGNSQPKWNYQELLWWSAAGCPERSQWKFPLAAYPRLEQFATMQQARLQNLDRAISQAETRLATLNRQLQTHGQAPE